MLEKKLDIKLANENSLIDRVKSATVKYARNTVVAVGIVLGSASYSGCGSGGGSESSEGCSHTVGNRATGYSEPGCSPGYSCESYTYTNKHDETKTGYHCVSDNPTPDEPGKEW